MNATMKILIAADGCIYTERMLAHHGHGALAGLLMASVATKLLALSKTPVLLVR